MADADPEVLIIGAGASGAVAAKRLVEEGFDVVCLEQGDWPDYTLARAAEPDYELTGARDWNWDPNPPGRSGRLSGRRLRLGHHRAHVERRRRRHRGLRGALAAQHAVRLRVRTLDGVADDWPLTYEDLEPYYVRVERDWGVSGLAGDTGFPGGEGRRCRRSRSARWADASPGPTTSSAGTGGPRRTRSPPGRMDACAPACSVPLALRGCADGAKASVDITYWPDAIERGAKLAHGRAGESG